MPKKSLIRPLTAAERMRNRRKRIKAEGGGPLEVFLGGDDLAALDRIRGRRSRASVVRDLIQNADPESAVEPVGDRGQA